MKFLLLAFLAITNLSAQTFTEGEELYAKRGESVDNATKALNIFKKLADSESDKFKKLDIASMFARSSYYVAQNIDDKSRTEKLHGDAADYIEKLLASVGVEVSKKIEFTKDYSKLEKEIVAMGLYQYGANLGKWGETRGIIASIRKLPLLKGAMKGIKTLGEDSTEAFGADRILARADYKTSKKEDGFKTIQEVVKNTLIEGTNISSYGLNNIYLAEFSGAHPAGEAKGKELACKTLKEFVDVNPETYNVNRIPETKKEIEEAKILITEICK